GGRASKLPRGNRPPTVHGVHGGFPIRGGRPCPAWETGAPGTGSSVRAMSTLAAIDCGTNSTRLIVSEGEGRARRTLDRRMLTTRLGQGLGATGAFAPEAVARTPDALRTYR